MSPGYPGDPVGPLTQLCQEVLLRENQHQAVPPVVAEIPQCNEVMGLELGLEPPKVEVSLKQREQLSHQGSGGLVCLPAVRAQAEPKLSMEAPVAAPSQPMYSVRRLPKVNSTEMTDLTQCSIHRCTVQHIYFPMKQAICRLYFRVHILQVTRSHSY